MKMGSSFKKVIFDEHVQEGLVGWIETAKKKGRAPNSTESSSNIGPASGSVPGIQMQNVGQKESGTNDAGPGNSGP